MARIARPGDLVITVGCGDVTKVAPKIVDEIQRLTRRCDDRTATVRRSTSRKSPRFAPVVRPVEPGSAGRGAVRPWHSS